MPTPTYDLIEEQVLSSAQASVTFSSIPGTYKDLVLEYVATAQTNSDIFVAQFNSDTGSNYSYTYLVGYGSGTPTSGRASGTSLWVGALYTAITNTVMQIQSYANTNVFKTFVSRSNQAANQVYAAVGLWRSTSAITSITLFNPTSNVASGSTFRLWGVSG